MFFFVDLCLLRGRKAPLRSLCSQGRKQHPGLSRACNKEGNSPKNMRRSCQFPSAALPLPLSRHLSPQSHQQLSDTAVHVCLSLPLPNTSQDKRNLGKAPPLRTHSHQADPLQACSQKSCWFFFSQPFLCLKWTPRKEKVRNEQRALGLQMCGASLPKSLLAPSPASQLEERFQGLLGVGGHYFSFSF